MIDLLIFDFDNTLVMTDDLKSIREQGKDRGGDSNYRIELESMIGAIKPRLIYTEEDLKRLRAENPSTKFALFTLAPMAYLEVIDNFAYPNFFWDDVVCFESITENRYKPSGFGIKKLMERNGLLDVSRVAMVGDSIKDISAAYNAGCYAVLDKYSWPKVKTDQHWSASKLMPDLIIDSKTQLYKFLKDPTLFLPALEFLLTEDLRKFDDLDFDKLRFDGAYHFAPRGNTDFDRGVTIFSSGRLFSSYKSLEARRRWHDLTASIYKHKYFVDFETSWLFTVLGFIKNHYGSLHLRKRPLIVSCIPDRPGRIPRQRAFIRQIEDLYQNTETDSRRRINVKFSTNIFEYKPSVSSNSSERLSFNERFENVKNNLYINEDSDVIGNDYLIIDDVVTSGASLMYAKQKLKKAGARNINLLALAKTVTDLKLNFI